MLSENQRYLLKAALVVSVVVAAAFVLKPAHAQDGESRAQHRATFYCGRLADSSALVAAYTRAGSDDVAIHAQMASAGVMPLSDDLRLATERVSRVLAPNQVMHLSFQRCMASRGYN
jgi:hypothetical protein